MFGLFVPSAAAERKSDQFLNGTSAHHRLFDAVQCARFNNCVFLITEWLLLRRCNLSNIGGRVYVRVRVTVSFRVIFSITWPRPFCNDLCLTGCSVVTIVTAF